MYLRMVSASKSSTNSDYHLYKDDHENDTTTTSTPQSSTTTTAKQPAPPHPQQTSTSSSSGTGGGHHPYSSTSTVPKKSNTPTTTPQGTTGFNLNIKRTGSLPNNEEEASLSDDDTKGLSKQELKEGDIALIMKNLPWWTTDQQIEDLLLPYGMIQTIRFVEDKTNGKSKGQCFISFEQTENVIKALEQLNDLHIDGKPISVSKTTMDSFESLNTHNRGRKERREYMSQKPEYPPSNMRTGYSRSTPPGVPSNSNSMSLNRNSQPPRHSRGGGSSRSIDLPPESPDPADNYSSGSRRYSSSGSAAPHINPAFFILQFSPWRTS